MVANKKIAVITGSMTSYGTIYCLTNIVNNKQYFGQTTKNIEKYFNRYKLEVKNGSERYIHRAIRKYGWNNFKKEVICECGDKLSLGLIEDLYINCFNTLTPSGYNLKRGGTHGKLSEQSKQKFSDIVKKRYEDPKEREKTSKANIKRYEDPKEREKTSKAQKKRYEDPKEREKLSKAQKKRYEDPKEREKTSKANIKRYEDLKEREKTSKANIKRYEDLKEREKISKTLKNFPEIFCPYCNKKYKYPKYLEKHKKKCKLNI